VVARLNEFYELIVPVLTRHGGHANKFIGDGLLGVFGAPDRRADHADRAVAAALEIAALVREQYAGRLRVGIGVNSGPVLAGTVGGGGRLEFTVIGDPVNTAARVETATRETGDDILVTEATRALVGRAECTFEERREVALRGKRTRVRLFACTPAGRSPAAVAAGGAGEGV
jgi:class 3 adenylate cyclase